MKVFQIIGQPGAGKTTLVADLVKEMVTRRIAVGTIKHTAHRHELDRPGKDSFVHRSAGAAPAAMITPDLAAVYLPRSDSFGPEEMLKQFYSHLQIVLIEGWISGPYDKIEIWRPETGRPPLFSDISTVRALVSDAPRERIPNTEHLICFDRRWASPIVDFMLNP